MLKQCQEAKIREEAEVVAQHLSKIMNHTTVTQDVVAHSGEITTAKIFEVQDFFRREVVRHLSMQVEGGVAEHNSEIREMSA